MFDCIIQVYNVPLLSPSDHVTIYHLPSISVLKQKFNVAKSLGGLTFNNAHRLMYCGCVLIDSFQGCKHSITIH